MADLTIKINGDVSDFKSKLKEVEKETANLSASLSTTAKVSGAAFAGLTGIITGSIMAYRGQELAVNQLNSALKNQGIYSDELTKEYQDQAAALQELTTYGDEEIVAAQAMLQAYTGENKITKELTQSILDFASAKGIDLKTAADLVGKSIGSTTNALGRYGIQIDSTASATDKMTMITAKLNEKFGGQSQAAAQGTGQFIQLKNAVGDLFEEIGKNLVPAIAPLVKGLREVVSWVQKHPEFATLAAKVLLIGVAVTGLVTALSLGGLAFIKFRAIMLATTVAVQGMSLSIKGLLGATGIGLLLVVVGDLAINWKTRFAQMQAVFEAFTKNIGSLGSGLTTILKGVFTVSPENIKKGLADVKAAFIAGFDDYSAIKEQKLGDANNKEIAQINEQNAEKQEIELSESARRLEALEEEKATQLELKKELEWLEFEELQAQREELQNEILAKNEEFQAMTDEQKNEFLLRNKDALAKQILDENTAKQKAAADAAKLQIDNNNRFLLEQQKFGTAYAAISKSMHSEIYQGTKSAFGELGALTQSENKTLKGIGKVAAVANIIIKTAESAMNIFAGFSSIPFIGPALGAAGAAAAVAFGAEQIGRVNSAAFGGIVPGVGSGDKIPMMLEPGELVVPKQITPTFLDLAREQAAPFSETKESAVNVMIGFDGAEAESVLTARQIEARALGISSEG